MNILIKIVIGTIRVIIIGMINRVLINKRIINKKI